MLIIVVNFKLASKDKANSTSVLYRKIQIIRYFLLIDILLVNAHEQDTCDSIFKIYVYLNSKVKHKAVRVFLSQSVNQRSPSGMLYHFC